jgi:hypothetical protein
MIMYSYRFKSGSVSPEHIWAMASHHLPKLFCVSHHKNAIEILKWKLEINIRQVAMIEMQSKHGH